MDNYVAPALLAILGLFLVSAGIQDARTREIANWKTAAVALLAPLWWWANGIAPWPNLALQIGVAVLVFGAFVAAYALGQMGGGDVKLIGALALWLPPTPLLSTLIVMSLVGGAVTLVLLIEARWRRDRGQIEIPYGVAIAIAGLIAIQQPIFNHFS